MSKTISFLLGAGFSFLDDYPMAPQMNERLKQINKDEIMVHTSNKAMFLNGQEDVNSYWMGMVERNFTEKFLEFYNNEIIKESFDYEEFYDYYKTQYRNQDYDERFLEFCEQFKKGNGVEIDAHNLLHRFDIVYNQLVAQMVTKFYNPTSLGKPYKPKYKPFFEIVELLQDSSIIHFHSLNHDLFLEYLSASSTMKSELSDGFQELGSKYFGNFKRRYKVRLSFFNEKFDTKYRLYKLHGSVDNYSYNFEAKWVYLKIKHGIDTADVVKEVERDDEISYIRAIDNFYPEFLSGKSDKILQYTSDEYYKSMFTHFKDNLQISDLLVIIGYSFQDDGINEYITENYLTSEDKKVVVVDVNDPQHGITQRQNTHLDLKGVGNFSVNEIGNFLA